MSALYDLSATVVGSGGGGGGGLVVVKFLLLKFLRGLFLPVFLPR
jgi:hypothetical protein